MSVGLDHLGRMVSSRVAAWQVSARGKNVGFEVAEAVDIAAYVDPCLTTSALDAVLPRVPETDEMRTSPGTVGTNRQTCG